MKKKKKYTGVFSEEAKVAFLEEVAKTHIPFLAKEASSEDNGTFEVIASTSVVDRHGEIILQEGIDASNYMKNPVILYGHDYWALPIGKATSVELIDGKTIIKGVFASGEANPVAQQCRKLYEEGILKTVSVGIIVKEWEGAVITKCELLELSFVPVPANPEALDIAKQCGMDEETIKRLFVDEKTVEDDAKGEDEEEEETTDEDSKEMKAIKTLVEVVKSLNKNIEDLKEENKNLMSEVVGIKTLVAKTVEENEDAKSKLATSQQMGKLLSNIVSKHNEVLKK